MKKVIALLVLGLLIMAIAYSKNENLKGDWEIRKSVCSSLEVESPCRQGIEGIPIRESTILQDSRIIKTTAAPMDLLIIDKVHQDLYEPGAVNEGIPPKRFNVISGDARIEELHNPGSTGYPGICSEISIQIQRKLGNYYKGVSYG